MACNGETWLPFVRYAEKRFLTGSVMNPQLLDILADPRDGSALFLENAILDAEGRISEGFLVAHDGRRYPITGGIPRFVEQHERAEVASFGDEWNHFNYDAFRVNWVDFVVKNTFGSTGIFRNRCVVDAGAGSGMQTRWIAEAGASWVIALELSPSVDDVMARNLSGLANVDVIQCSIDAPPLRSNIADIVYCHNVIQHTPSVETTARALWQVVAEGGEFVFNCYQRNDEGALRGMRFRFNAWLRGMLSNRSFRTRLAYAKTMGMLRLIPGLGRLLELSTMMYRGHVPSGPDYLRRSYRQGVLNTFDWFGAHAHQHYKADSEILALVAELQPDNSRVANLDRYFQRPPLPGCALRLRK